MTSIDYLNLFNTFLALVFFGLYIIEKRLNNKLLKTLEDNHRSYMEFLDKLLKELKNDTLQS